MSELFKTLTFTIPALADMDPPYSSWPWATPGQEGNGFDRRLFTGVLPINGTHPYMELAPGVPNAPPAQGSLLWLISVTWGGNIYVEITLDGVASGLVQSKDARIVVNGVPYDFTPEPEPTYNAAYIDGPLSNLGAGYAVNASGWYFYDAFPQLSLYIAVPPNHNGFEVEFWSSTPTDSVSMFWTGFINTRETAS